LIRHTRRGPAMTLSGPANARWTSNKGHFSGWLFERMS
jgi:hypothetical protein